MSIEGLIQLFRLTVPLETNGIRTMELYHVHGTKCARFFFRLKPDKGGKIFRVQNTKPFQHSLCTCICFTSVWVVVTSLDSFGGVFVVNFDNSRMFEETVTYAVFAD